MDDRLFKNQNENLKNQVGVRGILLILLTLVFLILVACENGEQLTFTATGTMETTAESPTATFEAEIDIPFVNVEQNDWGFEAGEEDSPSPKMIVIKNANDIPAIADSITPESRLKLNAINYDLHVAIIIWQGRRNASKFGVEVQRIVRKNNQIQIFTIFKSPQPGFSASQALTLPYQIVQIDRLEENQAFQYITIVDDQIVATYPKN